MNYLPSVRKMHPVAGGPLGEKHKVILFDQIESVGSIQYTFLVAVFEKDAKLPVLVVSSEVNTTAQVLGGGSNYLCVFDEDGHANMGSSDDWADPKQFFPKALQIAAGRLGIEIQPHPPQPDDSIGDSQRS